MASFRQWLLSEGDDIFGFDRRAGLKPKAKPPTEAPVHDIQSDVVMEFLAGCELGGMRPISEFSTQIRWGSDPGAVQMVISPLGSYKSIIRRLQNDLEGRGVWTCKKILPYKEILDANMRVDERLAAVVMEHVQKIHAEAIEAPSHDYNGLRHLVGKLSRVVQRKGIIPQIFVYRGVREAKANEHYILAFELRGHGVEAPGSSRVEQFHIEMCYSPSTGMIRSFGHDIQSPTRGHVWYPQPSEWDEHFSSGQSEHEIVECICSALSTY